MDIARLRQLSGTTRVSTQGETSLYRELTEVVEIPGDITMEELVKRLDACKRALSIVSTLPDPADKKKWLSATFVNLNKVRGALQRMMKSMGADVPAEAPEPVSPGVRPPALGMTSPASMAPSLGR
jgi:hypothetical protein